MLLPSRPLSLLILIIQEDANGCAIEILILAILHRPQEGAKANRSHEDRDRDENQEKAHCRLPSVAVVDAVWVSLKRE